MPDWSDARYAVAEREDRILHPRHEFLDDDTIVIDRAVRYMLADPNNTLKQYKEQKLLRSELLLLKTKAR